MENFLWQLLFACLGLLKTQKVHIRIVLFKNVVSILVVLRDKIFASGFYEILYLCFVPILRLGDCRCDWEGRIVLQPGSRLILLCRPLQAAYEAQIDLRRSGGGVLLVKLRHLKGRIVGHLSHCRLFLSVWTGGSVVQSGSRVGGMHGVSGHKLALKFFQVQGVRCINLVRLSGLQVEKCSQLDIMLVLKALDKDFVLQIFLILALIKLSRKALNQRIGCCTLN